MTGKRKKKKSFGFKLMRGALIIAVVGGVAWGIWQMTPGKREQRLVNHALRMMDDKAWGEATVALRKALKIYPKDKGVRRLLMQSLFAGGKPEQGLAEMETLLLTPPFADNMYDSLFDDYYGMMRAGGKPASMHAMAEKMHQVLPSSQQWMSDLLDARAVFLEGKRERALKQFRKLVDDGGTYYLLQMDMAEALLATGKYEDAEALYRRLLKQEPTSVALLNNLAMTLTLQGKASQAMESYMQASLLNEPPEIEILSSGALFAMNQNRLEEAQRHFIGRLAKYYPDDIKTTLVRLRYDVLKKDERHFFRILDAKASEMDTGEVAALADWCINHRQPRWVLRLLSDYAPADMDSDFATGMKVLALVGLHQQNEAKELLGEIGDKFQQAYLKAELDLQSGNMQVAADAFGKLADAENDVPTRIRQMAELRLQAIKAARKRLDNADLLPRARVLLAQGKADVVLRLLSGVKDPDAETGLLEVMALKQLKRDKEASARLEALHKRYPDREDVWLLWGRNVAETDAKKALQGLQGAVIGKANGPALQSLLGEVQYKVGQHDAAIETWRMVAERWPNTLAGNVANVLRAQAYMKKNDWASASRTWELVLEIAPDDPITLNNFAYCLLQEGHDLERARTMAEHALQIQPRNAAIEDTLEQIRKAMN